MPLKDELPVIDDRTYADIVDEIRVRIARYTPEWRPVWSDVNDSDPGITLAQVFAWLSEMLLYRMNRVPELNYIKFLELIGIELLAAQPATAEVSFAVAMSDPPNNTPAVVSVPPRTQVSATADDGAPLVFETTRALSAVACRLLSVQSYDGAQYRDLTGPNTAAAEGFHPFGELPRSDGALLLGWAFPEGHPNENSFPSMTLDLAFWTTEPVSDLPRVYQCGDSATRSNASAKLQWEAWNGVDWAALDLLDDATLAFTRGGHMLVRVRANVQMARDYMGAYDSIDPLTNLTRPRLFWLRARLITAQYERAPRLLAVRTNTVPVEQAETVEREVLGGANGTRNQTWQFENAPVIKGSVAIEIDDGTGARVWQAVDDLFGVARDKEVLAINYTSGAVVTGDGENGAIPVANPANPDANVVALKYRFGGGMRGNVAAKAISHLLTPVENIDNGQIENLFAASGGSDEENVDDAKKRARLVLRARERAVTPEDFEFLAQQAGNIKRAKALPLAHPRFPGVKVPGAITVIVVPDSDSLAPTPGEGLLRTVCEFLDARRLLTTEVFIVAPRYITVAISAQVVVRDDANPAAVRLAIENSLSDYFHALKGGDDGNGWPFGGPIRYSRVVQRVFGIDGVDSIPKLVLTVDDEEKPECRDVPLSPIAPNALLILEPGGLQIETLTQREAEAPL